MGNSEARSTVGVASMGGIGVGEGVSVGSVISALNGVGVETEGWNGVGVGEAFGATVTKTIEGEAGVGAEGEAPQAVRLIAMRIVGRIRGRMRRGRECVI